MGTTKKRHELLGWFPAAFEFEAGFIHDGGGVGIIYTSGNCGGSVNMADLSLLYVRVFL